MQRNKKNKRNLRKSVIRRKRPHVKVMNLADKDLTLSNMFKALEEDMVLMIEQIGTVSEETQTSENKW